jgi:hypothetical protein
MEVKRTIKINGNKIILKTKDGEETYIKTNSLDDLGWIVFKGEVYQLEKKIYDLEE